MGRDVPTLVSSGFENLAVTSRSATGRDEVRGEDARIAGVRHSMRVPGQIVQNVLGAAEGALCIYHPVFARQGPQKLPECDPVG
jgi:hypothetical protein